MKDRNKIIKTEFNFADYHVVVQRKSKNKNIYFRMQNDGSILITTPYHTSENEIKAYLEDCLTKIKNKYQLGDFKKVSYHKGGIVTLLGIKYQLMIKNSFKNYVKVEDNTLEVHVKENDEQLIKKLVDKFILDQAKTLITTRFNEVLKIYKHIDFVPELKIKKLKAKFGICYYKQNKIIISSELIHYDIDCIDYVIIHELAHFVQPNHSKKFYYLVENYLPNYKEIERKLKHLK